MNHTAHFAIGVLAALMLTGGDAGAPSPADAAQPAGNSGQELAMLRRATQALSSPALGSTPVALVSGTRPITGEQTVLPVIAHATDAHGTAWLRVLLPGRPNSATGWITAVSTTPTRTQWQITIRISTRRVTALLAGRVARVFNAVVGKPSTPTPLGRFFVEESVKLHEGDVGAPYALALSARSNVLQEFDGGPGQIALHGTNNVGGTPGTAASHGCIRLGTEAITWLADRIAPGTPVTITP